jgi:hypothetical protein
MKADLRISIKDYRRKKNLKILLFRPPSPGWRLVAALRKALVMAGSSDDC